MCSSVDVIYLVCYQKLTILGKAPVRLRPKNSVDWLGGSDAFEKKREMGMRSVC